MKLVGNLSWNKSLGLNTGNTIKVLKNYVDPFKGLLTYLIKLSFQQVTFPGALKTARVTQILKKDDPLLPYLLNTVLSPYFQFLVNCLSVVGIHVFISF